MTHFDESVGFNASTVYVSAQDKLGFIWIGTNAGLIRYDGIKFESFDIEDGLIDLNIFNMEFDSSNHILLHNFSNKPNYYYNGNFYSSLNDTTLSTLQLDNTMIIEYDKKSDAFLLSAFKADYFYYLKIENGKIVVNEKIDLAEGERVAGIVSMDNFYYLFYALENSDKTLYRVYSDTTLHHQGEIDYIASQVGFAVLENEIGFLDAQNVQKIIFYSVLPTGVLEKGREQKINFSAKNIYSSYDDLWITLNEGGVLKLNRSGATEHLLEDKTVNNLLVDHNENLWIGTEGDGMYYIQNHGVTNIGIDKLETSNRVISLCTSDDNI